MIQILTKCAKQEDNTDKSQIGLRDYSCVNGERKFDGVNAWTSPQHDAVSA